MNTRKIAKEYRLAHWAGIMREREASGLSIRAYCASAGFHENIYFYWQRKLREAACEELAQEEVNDTSLAVPMFAEISLPAQPTLPTNTIAHNDQLYIDAAGIRLTAGREYPIDKLAELLRAVLPCC